MTITVEACFVYPLKSAAAGPVAELELTPRGPVNDRRWLLVHDAQERRGLFITQREPECARLALVAALPAANGSIEFRAPEAGALWVDQSALSERDGTVEIWGDHCRALDAGDEAAHWFSGYLGFPCRLVKMDERFERPTDPGYSRPGDHVSFADGMPLLVANTASLSALNERIGDGPVGMERFRPNLVLSGAAAFEEDVMHELRIGEAVLEFTKPCARCKVPTIDQTTGLAPSNEPMSTLVATRRGNAGGLRGVFFGQNAFPRQLAPIRRGDTVEVLSRQPMHPVLENAELRYAP